METNINNYFLVEHCDIRIERIEQLLEHFRSTLDAPDEEVLPLCHITYMFLHMQDELYLLIRANQEAVEVEASPELYAVLKLQISKMVGLINEMDALKEQLLPYLFCPAVDEV